MKQKRKRYTDEFKKEAARLMIMDGLSAPEVSKKLGVNAGQLYTWKKKYLRELGGAAKKDGDLTPTQMASELDRVRKQLARSERINEILKKTVGYFAKDE